MHKSGLYLINQPASHYSSMAFKIEKKAMLSSKEAKEVCYALLDNNFVTTRVLITTHS